MPKCAFSVCKNVTSRLKKVDGISYFRFPRNPIQREKWASIVSQERNQIHYKPNKSSVVCSQHFSKSDLYVTDKGIKRILKTAVPQIHVADDNNSETSEDENVNEPSVSDERTGITLLHGHSSEVIENMIESTSDVPGDLACMTTPVNVEYNNESLSRVPSPDTILYPPGMVSFHGKLDKRRKRMIEKDKVTNNLKKKNVRPVKKKSTLKSKLNKLKKQFHHNSRLPRPAKSLKKT